ncbi:MAG TPA: hypothetical protein VGH73_07115 [Thermoanaerobaculia bacterium]|jgi:hypothetical protein
MRIHFVLVGEGPSDEGLIPHLENLCIELGATEVTGTAPDFQRLESPIRKTVIDKLQAALQLEPTANLFFVHRDADSKNPVPRYTEISTAAGICDLKASWVAVVPVQETEAWLLLDEAAIRSVAGHPRGRSPLGLPHPREVEEIAKPKERLKEVLVIASELSGRRLAKFRKEFSNHRRLLLQRMTSHGALPEVNSWLRLRSDLKQAIRRLQRVV